MNKIDRQIKNFKKRIKKISDYEVFDLVSAMTSFLLPRLKRYKKLAYKIITPRIGELRKINIIIEAFEILDRDDQDQGPEDQREDSEHIVMCWSQVVADVKTFFYGIQWTGTNIAEDHT